MADEPSVAWIPPVTKTLEYWIKSNIYVEGELNFKENMGNFQVPEMKELKARGVRADEKQPPWVPTGFPKFPDAEQCIVRAPEIRG